MPDYVCIVGLEDSQAGAIAERIDLPVVSHMIIPGIAVKNGELWVESGRGPRMDADLAALAGEPDLAGKTIGDLAAAEGRATAETLAKNGCPVRTFHIDTVDEAAMGELLMHYMLETMIGARLLGVDAFDQPAVEEGKILAKRYSAET